jgi:hypothetical protein
MARTVEKELCEFFADDCRRAAEQINDPQHRVLLLKLAQQWLTAAQEHEALTQLTPQNAGGRARSGLA